MFFSDEVDGLFRKMSAGSLDLASIVKEFERAGHMPNPFYYGYTMTVGPDGKPVIKEYGNAKLGASAINNTAESDEYQPLVDVIVDEKDNTIKLVAEIPGVEKNDIQVVVDKKSVNIVAKRDQKNYRTNVPISYDVDKDSANASYKNGILEISLKALVPKPTGKTVEVN